MVLGYQLETADHIAPGILPALVFIVLAAFFTAAAAWRMGKPLPGGRIETDVLSGEASAPESAAGYPAAPRRFFLTWICIALPNLIVLLGVYPGFFVYDAQDELMQVITRNFSTHHPLFHVLSMGGTIAAVHKLTDSWNAGIFLWLLLQMLLITAIYAFVLGRLRSMGLSARLVRLFTLWYAFFPTVVMYTLCSTKDGLFTAFTTLFVTELAGLFLVSGREQTASGSAGHTGAVTPRSLFFDRGHLLLFISAAAMMLLRNNALYMFLVLLILIAAVSGFRPQCRTRRTLYPAGILLLSMLLFLCMNKAMILATHADDSEHQEMLSVPIQGLGRAYAYHPELFTTEERETLFSYLSQEALDHYEPRNCDLLKASFNNNRYSKDKVSFWSLWSSVVRRCPMTMVNSWLLTSYGNWYPFAVHNVYQGHTVFTFTYTESSYFGYETELPGVRRSLIPPIDRFYRWLSLDDTIQRIPVLSLLFNPAFYFWVYVWVALRLIYQKRGRGILPFVPLLLLWGTYLIGPYYLVRYLLPFFTALPVLVRMLSNDVRKKC